MKLATRYHRINLLFTISIFILASIVFYFLLQKVLTKQVDEDLQIEQREMDAWIEKYDSLPEMISAVEDQVIAVKTTGELRPEESYRTVVLYDEADEKWERFRQMKFGEKANGVWYEVSVSKSLEGSEELARQIGIIAISIIMILLITLVLVNKLILQKLWSPFYQSIENLRLFTFGKEASLALPDTNIEEFQLLNNTLIKAADKATRDFLVLKEFTENASHELQTPLAIVRGKLDMLMQEEGLTKQQSVIINEAELAISRMAHLNSSLLTLAKIENGQYADGKCKVDIKKVLAGLLQDLQPIIQDRELITDYDLAPAFLEIVPSLAEILLTNLLTNAIYHNKLGGTLQLRLSSDSLSVCNSAIDGELDGKMLFQRFGSNNKSTRTGLGLAIAKEVCDKVGYELKYKFTNKNQHCFTVLWDKNAAGIKSRKAYSDS